ncbi:MAG TPA: hypothetical protein VE685_03755 [Thermoanaerobaculia bacterium]|nr:hypothetical protein [Thermoanaerobaculia bacterium]
MRRLLRIAILLLVLLAVAGHVFHAYWPRERAAAPEPGGLPARLLSADAHDACVWVPYPHQNLGALAGTVEDGSAWLASAARVAGVPPPVLPSFGPFAVPPSREVTACSDLDGERFVLAARVYPAVGVVARLAGRLTGNPWLEGGEIRETEGKTDEVVERTLRVAWRDGVWMVTSGEPPAIAPGVPAVPSSRPLLGIVRLRQEVSDFPEGNYLLQRRERDLELSLAGGAPAPERPDFGGQPLPVLLAVAGPSWPAASARPLPPAAFALFDIADGGIQAGPLGKLPGAAVFHPRGREGERWALPAQGIAGLLTEGLPRGNAAGWRIVALDAGSLARARDLAPGISSLTPPEGDGSDGRLVAGVWLDPKPALRLVAQTRKVLEKIPLVDREQVRLWRDWERILHPVAGCEEISLVATQSPPSFGLRLHGCN